MKNYCINLSSVALLAVLLVSCAEQQTDVSPFSNIISIEASSSGGGADVYIVSPSGDVSGVTDANNIQAAIDAVANLGGTVYLTDGNTSTTDHYFVSQGIIALTGFNGCVKGENQKKTVIEAVKQGDGSTFEFSFDSDYITNPTNPNAGIWPTVFHFDYPEQVIMKDLTITHSDPAPGARYFQHIAVWGGDHTVVITDVSLHSDPAVSDRGVGIHVMGGTRARSLDGIGNILIRNVEVSNLRDAIAPMWYGDGSAINIEGVNVTNAFWGVYGEGLTDGLHVFGSSFTSCYGSSMTLRSVNNAHIIDNTIIDQVLDAWWKSGIYLRHGITNSIVSNNTFINLNGTNGQAIFVRGINIPEWDVNRNTIEQNIFTESGLPGWTSETPNGPGAVRVGLWSSENYVHEMKFPAQQGITLCQMIWDQSDDPETSEYDGANSIHNWQPCENLAEREIKLEELEVEARFRVDQ